MSLLAWIDFDEAERQRAQRIMAMFQERETRDELGLGGIRDSIADHLFPGTSTIQTRLRYMLFIPWLYRMLESSKGTVEQIAEEGRSLEVRLAESLKAGGELHGVIGRDAGVNLQRMPSSVYWAGLGTWGIRLFPGSVENLIGSFRSSQGRRNAPVEDEEGAYRVRSEFWAPTLPPPPANLLSNATFALSSDEAQFIVDKLVAHQPESLLAFLAKGSDRKVDCQYIWQHPALSRFPEGTRRVVAHSEIFSSVMHGAALVYNLMLSQVRDNPEWIAAYSQQLEEWREGLNQAAIREWSLADFWDTTRHPAHTVQPAAKRFGGDWLDQVLADKVLPAAGSNRAAELVSERERRLKTNQSRFTNRAVLDRWTGASGTSRLSFRWAQARSHLKDLADAG
jgi:hypothetical protein